MVDVRLRLVCTNEGRHRPRVLATLDYRPDEDRLYLRLPGGRTPGGLPPGRYGALIRRMQAFGWHLQDDLGVEAAGGEVRLPLECPGCRPTPVLSEPALLGLARRHAHLGGVVVEVDTSDGAAILVRRNLATAGRGRHRIPRS
jgi:hypothetical protein